MKFGLSPCPNDTYIFYKFIQNKKIIPLFLDVEELNQLALKEEIPLIKVSCATAVLLKHYDILSCGGALGYGCGPLIISNQNSEENLKEKIQKYTIYIPGTFTTANFLFTSFCKENQISTKQLDIVFLRYNEIIPQLLLLKNKQQNALGILIHEERFIYNTFHLYLELDLGNWWERFTNLPIPLGCIVLHKDFSKEKETIENAIRESLLFSKENYHKVLPFIKEKAQTLDEVAIHNHIQLYVNEFSFNIQESGWTALQKMKEFILNSF